MCRRKLAERKKKMNEAVHKKRKRKRKREKKDKKDKKKSKKKRKNDSTLGKKIIIESMMSLTVCGT